MASADLTISNRLTIPGWSLTEVFKLAGGPGGQNVNKVETGVQLRFSYKAVDLFTESQTQRLEQLAGSRATKDGEILIDATRFRTRERNREDARERLGALITKAVAPPPPARRKTRPTRGSVERRLQGKTKRANVKRLRSRPDDHE